ncbi:WD40-repeat-containing domain protein [Coprinopsis sp. MPI-PUGE-AT-0042]|nr:WD40-repeat-containing domain protein [Coprinopsis sp. MPI-PUGE-AT-0042]
MRGASPPLLLVVDERGSRGGMDWPSGQGQSPSSPAATQGRDGYDRYPVPGRVMETPFNNPQPFGGAHQRVPAYNAGVTYNIGNAGNVFTGTNYGNVYMDSRSADEFMMNLADRLKICHRADHLYHAPGQEAALRRGQCTPGTRIDIIQGVVKQVQERQPLPTPLPIISKHLLSTETAQSYWAAVFFCSRQFLDTRSVSSIVRTLVYNLALRSAPFRDALQEHGRFETVTHGPRSQLVGLLITPWEKSAPQRMAANEPCYVLPIDALDELEGPGGTEFLGALFDVVEQLPGLKFFVTSRSDPALVKRILSFPSKQICRLEEVTLEESSADIKMYLEENLTECANPQEIQQLVSEAAVLFIYAATVVEYLKGRVIEEQQGLLKSLLSTASSVRRSPAATAKLDNLYLQILETCLVDPRERDYPDMFQDCLSILHTFLSTIERTSTSVAVDILNASSRNGDTVLGVGAADGVLHRLHAVLYSQGGLVMSFHKSFADFLFDKARSQRFFCDQKQQHHYLADGCFRIMTQQLRFNIAGISSSYQMDCDNLTLQANIETSISAPLRYACGNWSAHLALTTLEVLGGFLEAVHKFLQLRVLFWMEAMNLLGHRGRYQAMLSEAQKCFFKCKMLKNSTELVSKLADTAAFAGYHSMSKAAMSTPHLYLSSLATFSRHSAIVQNWRQQFGGIPGFVSAQGLGREAMVACICLRHRVTAVAVSSDGVNTAVGLADGSVQIWDLSTGEEVRVLKGHTRDVTGVAYSPDGTHVVSCSQDKPLRLWDVSTGEEVRVLEGHTWVNAVAYSPDGTHVVSDSSDRSLRLWDVSTGEVVRVLRGAAHLTAWVCAVAYSPDGTHVVSDSSDRSLRLWDVSTGEEVRVLKGHTSVVTGVAYSPDGMHIVSGSWDKSVRVWDVSTGEAVVVLNGHTSFVRAVAYSPDGTHVASVSDDKSVQVWDLSTGKVVSVLKGHTDKVCAVVYLPDGKHIVSGSKDKSLRIWDLATRQKGMSLKGHTSGVLGVVYSPDGTCVASASKDKSVRVCNVSTGEEVMSLTGHSKIVEAVAYSPDGTHIVSGSRDKSVRVWNISTGEEVRALNGHTGGVRAVAYSPDGTHVVSGSDDKSLRLWHLSTGKEIMVLEGHTEEVTATAYSPDGTCVVSGSRDKSVRVWDLSTGKEVMALMGHQKMVEAVAYLPDSTHIVSASMDRSVRVWNLSIRQEARALKGHTGGVRTVACSPDGVHIASGSGDKSVQVWDLSTGELVSVLKGHTDEVAAVAYSPDGNHIVSGSGDTSVRIWDVSPKRKARYIHQLDPKGQYTGWLLSPTDPSGYLMFVRPEALLPVDSNVLTIPASAVSHLDFSTAKFVVGSKVTALAISPDGVNIVVGSPDGLVQLIDSSTGEVVEVLQGHISGAHAVAYSPDGTHVLSGSNDKSVRVWDLFTRDEVTVIKGHTSRVRAVAYSPDGTNAVSGSNDKSIQTWNVSTGEETRLLKGHSGCVLAVAYSLDGSHIVSGSDDMSVRVWNLSTALEARVLKGHTNKVRAVAYSPDGTHVVSGSGDESVRVWNVFTGEGSILKGHAHWVWAVAYSPDGSCVISGSEDKSVQVWDVPTGEEVKVFEGHTDGVHSSSSSLATTSLATFLLCNYNSVACTHLGGLITVPVMPEQRESSTHEKTVAAVLPTLLGALALLYMWMDTSETEGKNTGYGADGHAFKIDSGCRFKRGTNSGQTLVAPEVILKSKENPNPPTVQSLGWTLQRSYGNGRALFLDFGIAVFKIAYLTHTSIQFYKKDIWYESVLQLRGFKVAIVFEFQTHVLAFLTNDLPEWFIGNASIPPTIDVGVDVYSDFTGFLQAVANWRTLRVQSKSARGGLACEIARGASQVFVGLGVYTVCEVFYFAGIHPLLTEKEVFDSPSRLARLCNAFWQYAHNGRDVYKKLVKPTIHDGIIAPNHNQRLGYNSWLRVYAKSLLMATPREAELILRYQDVIAEANYVDRPGVNMVFRDRVLGLFDPFEPTNMESALIGWDSTNGCLVAGKVFSLGSLTFGPAVWSKIAPSNILAYEDLLGVKDPLTKMFENEGLNMTSHPTQLDLCVYSASNLFYTKKNLPHPFPKYCFATRPKKMPETVKKIQNIVGLAKERMTFVKILEKSKNVAIGPLEYCGHGQMIILPRKKYVAAVCGDPRLAKVSSTYTQMLSLWRKVTGRTGANVVIRRTRQQKALVRKRLSLIQSHCTIPTTSKPSKHSQLPPPHLPPPPAAASTSAPVPAPTFTPQPPHCFLPSTASSSQPLVISEELVKQVMKLSPFSPSMLKRFADQHMPKPNPNTNTMVPPKVDAEEGDVLPSVTLPRKRKSQDMVLAEAGRKMSIVGVREGREGKCRRKI